MKNTLFSLKILSVFILFSINNKLKADIYPDQYFVIQDANSLINNAESIQNITLSSDNKYIVLEENQVEGNIVLNPVTLEYNFNRGLPSWNGRAPENQSSSFKIEMRFFVNENWSDWITVGYWDNYIWSSYGATDFSGGGVDIDYVKLNTYVNTFQYKISFKRTNSTLESPEFRQIAFTASDSEHIINIDSIVNDNPEEIFIPTDFICQYNVDDDIGGSICSPTTVSMIIRSYNIDVDPLSFARRNKDPYWGIYGVWPRVVTNASEFGLYGEVTRYRTWSEAAQVLQNGGRIGMSVGPPLYSGHLIMLAGFTSDGSPIVHDPAKQNGYSYIFNKQSLSESWFNKGGISYTFYLDSTAVNVPQIVEQKNNLSVYPNPVSNIISFKFHNEKRQTISLKIFDLNGKCISVVANSEFEQGTHTINKNLENYNIAKGMYIISLNAENKTVNKLFVIQ